METAETNEYPEHRIEQAERPPDSPKCIEPRQAFDTGSHNLISCLWFRADIKTHTEVAIPKRGLIDAAALRRLRAGAKRLERGLG